MPAARTLKEIRGNLKPKPLELDQLESLFVETSRARDPGLSQRKRLEVILGDEDDGTPVKVLFAGHGGAGKSTELVKLSAENEERFIFVELSISRDGNPNEVNIEGLLVLIVEAVLRKIDELKIPFEDDGLEKIYGWFDEVFEISKSTREMNGEVEAGVDTKGSLFGPLLGLTAKLKTGIRTGTSDVSTRIRREGGRLQQLATHCRDLLAAASFASFEDRASYPVLIIEDLDKISLQDADKLFVENPAPIADLPIRIIFTAPIFLQYTPKSSRLGGYFQSVTMPMIKVQDEDGMPFQPGIDVIRDILAHRIDLEHCFEPRAVELAIGKTGGVLRHLFDVLNHATLTAEWTKSEEGDGLPITEAHVRYGLDQLKKDLLRRISAAFLPEEFGEITTDELYGRLYDFREARLAESDPENLLLMQAHALIEYNGKGWHRVHPLVGEYLGERRKRNGEPKD